MLFQSVLVIFLLVKMDTFEGRLNVPEEPLSSDQQDVLIANYHPQTELEAAQSGLDSSQIRRIIREELRGIARSDELQVQGVVSPTDAPVYDQAEIQNRRQLVFEELDLLKQQEDVSSIELDNLVGEIAKLDPETRSEMLRELAQAMNRGEINGHF